MKHTTKCLFLALAFLISVGCDKQIEAPEKTETETTASSETAETPEPAVAVATESAEHFLIDVRSQAEWDEGHLETAIHIPHTDIVEGIKKVTDDKSAKIYLH